MTEAEADGEAPFEPGMLERRVRERTAAALRTGALQPIPTRGEIIEDAGVPFFVRVLDNLKRKEAAQRIRRAASAEAGRSPFLPWDPDLFVAGISPTHVCLLNKFNVMERHLLIVTREFREQESALERTDFEALATCMAEFDSLGFYNAGAVAGASQRHKHLQLVPLPLAPNLPPGAAGVPVSALLAPAPDAGTIGTVPRLPFAHALAALAPQAWDSPAGAAAGMLEAYAALLRFTGLRPSDTEAAGGPCNLLVTRRWMLLVPRARECFDSISINALGFAGALLVKTQEQLERLRRVGPMAALATVAAERRP